jgi:hypothetical protein
MRTRKTGMLLLLAGMMVVMLVSGGFAQTNVWEGSFSTNWAEGTNWSLGVTPGPDADVYIPVVVAARTPCLTQATEALASFTLASNQVLNVAGWDSAIIAREMIIAGVVRHASNTVATTNGLGQWVPQHRIWLKGSNITIKAGGRLDGDYRGYAVNAGPGRSGSVYSGAGHAGTGGRGPSGPGGPPYDDPATPEQPGSGGGGRIAVWDNVPPTAMEEALQGVPSRWMAPRPGLPFFSGVLQADPGASSVTGGVGTANFYRFSYPATIVTLR